MSAAKTWKCSICGRFVSDHSPRHEDCEAEEDRREIDDLRSSVERAW